MLDKTHQGTIPETERLCVQMIHGSGHPNNHYTDDSVDTYLLPEGAQETHL
jgi:hypothetical protein